MSASSGAIFGVLSHCKILTSKLASLLALTKQDDDNNDEHEVDHSELETLLQQWLDEKDKKDDIADEKEDTQDGLELQEVDVAKDNDETEDVELTDLDALLQCPHNKAGLDMDFQTDEDEGGHVDAHNKKD